MFTAVVRFAQLCCVRTIRIPDEDKEVGINENGLLLFRLCQPWCDKSDYVVHVDRKVQNVRRVMSLAKIFSLMFLLAGLQQHCG